MIHAILLILTICCTVKSRDSLAKFSEHNIISHEPSKRNIDDQLKTFREEKHEEYLHNTGCKSPLLENNKNKENQNNAIIFKTET